ncbi:metal ABC transporter substrate-binding protein [Streptomyces sodiiphilus]
MTVRRSTRTAPSLLAGTAALAMLTLSACGDSEGGAPSAAEEGTLDVVASFYPMAFVAERIGGEHVTVSTLTPPGVEPHDLELSPRQTARLTEADVIVHLEGLQPAVDAAVAQSGVGHLAEATQYVTLETWDDHDDEHADEDDHDEDDGHGHGEDDHDDDHDDDEHGHGEDDGHGHGAEDPHFWLDPTRYAQFAEGVGETLAEADPDNAADYRANTETLVGELNALDEEFGEGLSDTTTDTFITTHAAFGYLADRYGLREEAISGLDPESEPSAARMRELHRTAEARNVSTVFFETLASDATARTLAEDLGLETDILDPLEGITDETRGADYFEVMRANLEALQKALGATG